MLLVLVAGSSLRLLLTLAHYRLVASFVRSKPPGRKMVGGEIRVCSSSDICDGAGYIRHQRICSSIQRCRKCQKSEIDLINLEIGLSI